MLVNLAPDDYLVIRTIRYADKSLDRSSMWAYSGDIVGTRLVRYSNGSKLSVCWMFWIQVMTWMHNLNTGQWCRFLVMAWKPDQNWTITHKPTGPFKYWALKCLVFRWNQISCVQYLSPHCFYCNCRKKLISVEGCQDMVNSCACIE